MTLSLSNPPTALGQADCANLTPPGHQCESRSAITCCQQNMPCSFCDVSLPFPAAGMLRNCPSTMSMILGGISKSHHAFGSMRKNSSGRSQPCALINKTSCAPKGLGVVIPLHLSLAAARSESWHCFSMCATESMQDTSPSTSSPPATEPGRSSGMAVTLWRWFLNLDSLDAPCH